MIVDSISMAMTTLQYKTLDHTQHEFRLFRLDVDAAKSEQITGTLEIYSLNEKPRFRALSYEWGDSIDTSLILVNGQAVDIRANLKSFLSHFRTVLQLNRSIANELIWIDQISIDQSSAWERNHQVSLMSCIYSSAIEVIAWLGLNCTDSLRAVAENWAPRFYQDLCGAQLGHPRPATVADFYDLSFWDRLWTQQEVVLARTVAFMAGSFLLHASDLDLADMDRRHREREASASVAANPRFAPQIAMSNSIRWRERKEWKDALRGENSRGYQLNQILEYFAEKECADPRDRIYGLQGMVKEGDRVEIDYSLEAREVFARACKKIVELKQDYEVTFLPVMVPLGQRMGLSETEAVHLCKEARLKMPKLLEPRPRVSLSSTWTGQRRQSRRARSRQTDPDCDKEMQQRQESPPAVDTPRFATSLDIREFMP